MYEIEDDENPAQKELDEARRLLSEELRFVMGSPVGRRFVARVAVQMAGSDASTFSVDAAYSAYAQGRRDLGNELKQMVRDHDLGLFLKMEEEHYGRN